MVDNSAHPLWGISSGLEPSLGWEQVLRTLESNQGKKKAVIRIKPYEEGLGPVFTPVVLLSVCPWVMRTDAYNVAL